MMETVYQRTMKDMRKAGLNPILAYKMGGVQSAPSGAMPTIPDFGSTMARGMEAGIRGSKMGSEKDLNAANASSARAAAGQAASQTKLIDVQTKREDWRLKREEARGSWWDIAPSPDDVKAWGTKAKQNWQHQYGDDSMPVAPGDWFNPKKKRLTPKERDAALKDFLRRNRKYLEKRWEDLQK